jgi:hypothetical protein
VRRTTSAWGTPPRRLFQFLARAKERASRRSPRLIVVGCADGKFVLPAARRGWNVAAIDIDLNMTDGCPALPSTGIPHPVPGLVNRLEREGLTRRVEVRRGDYMKDKDLPVGDALWTSGALQYSANLSYSIEAMTDRLRQLLIPGGLAYIEYMIPNEEKLKGRPNCPPVSWWKTVFPSRGWYVVRHTLAYDVPDGPHPYVPWPHVHSWGRVLTIRVD